METDLLNDILSPIYSILIIVKKYSKLTINLIQILLVRNNLKIVDLQPKFNNFTRLLKK